MKVKYIVLMEDLSGEKIVMKWGKCQSLEDVNDFQSLYLLRYPKATFEVFEVK